MAAKKNEIINQEKIDFSMVTHHKFNELSYVWTLQNFNPKLFQTGELVESPVFPLENFSETAKWSIRVTFQKRLVDDNTYEQDMIIDLLSHARKDELLKHLPKLTISCTTFNTVKEIDNLLQRVIKFEDSTEVHVNTIQNIYANCDNDQMKKHFLLNFDCAINSNVKINGEQDNLKQLHRKFNWKIETEHFLINSCRNEFSVETPKFDFNENSSDDIFEKKDFSAAHKWSIHLYPRGRHEGYSSYMSIFLKHLGGPTVHALCEAHLDGNNSHSCVIIPLQVYKRSRRWGVGEFISLNKFSEIFGNNIKITYRIKLINYNTTKSEGMSAVDYTNKSSLDFLKKLYNSYKNQFFCDIALSSEIDKTYFKLHKLVLFAASKQFEIAANNDAIEMLFGNNEESLPVIKTAFSSSCLQKVINYLYKHELDRDYKFFELIEILKFSILYDVEFLTLECNDYIMKNFMNTENFFVLLDLGEKYLTHNLLEATHSYIRRYYCQISELQKWKDFAEENPALYMELLKKIME